MEHEITTSQIIINVLIQLFNIALFFFLVFKFLAKPITKSIVERMEKEKKLALADETYQQIIQDAEKQADDILKNASTHKDNLITQGELTAKQKYNDIVEDASRKADDILQTAHKQSELMKQDLEQHFISTVKSTSREIVKKLFANKEFEQTYVDSLIEEFTQKK